MSNFRYFQGRTGTPFVVVPSTSNESDDSDPTELNNQVFQGICSALHFLDQGLICSSRCNTATMRETSFKCYYILLPSDNGMMLLRKLAGLEENIKDSVKASLLEVFKPRALVDLAAAESSTF
ncbi:hypothetical protein L2E82_34806 [Cichorium intybus]|uniref:Uncharacterized protein n=1 Tax=Cichorium intybus TaxID=13427 RepID=A0ACB9BMS8_CICIN|nr:hypothetical protein L2E82_34806 [Cichorium intybus]